ncbi:MAG TPA: tocopherol cyclase, partial [Cyanobacteria bacterium UBA11368]|nr:tocopherol cyclase [Cyanobacteria bacterium UBA11368]
MVLNLTDPIQTPHSGYHWDGSDRRFFEGWYYRVTLPEDRQTFAFMYSIEDPIGGKPYSGGGAQIL